jgi:hypothetical protein
MVRPRGAHPAAVDCGRELELQDVPVSLSRAAVKGSPPYAPGSSVGRDEEASIYDHYRRPGYWAREVQLQNPEFRNISLGRS